jgi:hypothetical protein
MNLGHHGILRLFPNASPDLLARNRRKAAVVERNFGDAPLEKKTVQRRAGPQFLIRVTSFRKRLIDEDNLAEKYHIDLCRYAGIIPGDEAHQTKIETAQRKIEKGETEKILIEVFALDSPSTHQ